MQTYSGSIFTGVSHNSTGEKSKAIEFAPSEERERERACTSVRLYLCVKPLIELFVKLAKPSQDPEGKLWVAL